MVLPVDTINAGMTVRKRSGSGLSFDLPDLPNLPDLPKINFGFFSVDLPDLPNLPDLPVVALTGRGLAIDGKTTAERFNFPRISPIKGPVIADPLNDAAETLNSAAETLGDALGDAVDKVSKYVPTPGGVADGVQNAAIGVGIVAILGIGIAVAAYNVTR